MSGVENSPVEPGWAFSCKDNYCKGCGTCRYPACFLPTAHWAGPGTVETRGGSASSLQAFPFETEHRSKLREYNGALRQGQDTVRAPERRFIMNWVTQKASPGMTHLSFLEGCPECLRIKRVAGRENYPSKGMQVGRYGDTCRKKRGIGKREGGRWRSLPYLLTLCHNH